MNLAGYTAIGCYPCRVPGGHTFISIQGPNDTLLDMTSESYRVMVGWSLFCWARLTGHDR